MATLNPDSILHQREEEDDSAAALEQREENEQDEDVNEAARAADVKTNDPRG